jgi:hypothetical protein
MNSMSKSKGRALLKTILTEAAKVKKPNDVRTKIEKEKKALERKHARVLREVQKDQQKEREAMDEKHIQMLDEAKQASVDEPGMCTDCSSVIDASSSDTFFVCDDCFHAPCVICQVWQNRR